MFWDFGAGQIGDMGSHTMDLLWNAVDAGIPTSAEAKGEAFNPDVTPVECESHFEHAANDWRGPLRVSWYQGGVMPRSPNRAIDLKAIDHGAYFKGSKGFLVADFTSRMIIPFGGDADLTYYKPRSKENQLPPVGHFQTAVDRRLQGSVAQDRLRFRIQREHDRADVARPGRLSRRQEIEYDGSAGKITNAPEANEFLSRKYRDGWVLNG